MYACLQRLSLFLYTVLEKQISPYRNSYKLRYLFSKIKTFIFLARPWLFNPNKITVEKYFNSSGVICKGCFRSVLSNIHAVLSNSEKEKYLKFHLVLDKVPVSQSLGNSTEECNSTLASLDPISCSLLNQPILFFQSPIPSTQQYWSKIAFCMKPRKSKIVKLLFFCNHCLRSKQQKTRTSYILEILQAFEQLPRTAPLGCSSQEINQQNSILVPISLLQCSKWVNKTLQ